MIVIVSIIAAIAAFFVWRIATRNGWQNRFSSHSIASVSTLAAGVVEHRQRVEQEGQRMESILTRENREADRKWTEAKCIADFQSFVASDISERLLRSKGVELSEEIAPSMNTGVIDVSARDDRLTPTQDTRWIPGMLLF